MNQGDKKDQTSKFFEDLSLGCNTPNLKNCEYDEVKNNLSEMMSDL